MKKRGLIGFIMGMVSFGIIACGSESVSREEYDELRNDIASRQSEIESLEIQYMESGEETEAAESKEQDLSQMSEEELLENHSITVEITKDNWDDYMELMAVKDIDEFGEETGIYVAMFKSKLYEDGYVLYDNSDFLMKITWGFSSLTTSNPFGEIPLFGLESEKAILEHATVDNVKGSLVFVEKSALYRYSCEDGERVVNSYIMEGDSRAAYPY